MIAKVRLHLRDGGVVGAAHGLFNTLKGSSPQLLKSNLGSDWSKGLALAFDVDKKKGGMSLNLLIKSTNLMLSASH